MTSTRAFNFEALSSELYYFAGLCAAPNALEAKRESWFALVSMGGSDMPEYLNKITDAVRNVLLHGGSPLAAARTVIDTMLEDIARWAKPLF